MSARLAGPASGPRTAGAGFTLLELLIVVSILGMVAVVGVSATSSSFDRNCLVAAAEEIRSAVNFAQLRAASTGMAARVVFDDVNDRIAVEQLAPDVSVWNPAVTVTNRTLIDPPANAPVRHPLRRGLNYQVMFSAGPRYGAVDLSAPIFGSSNILTFDGYGRPSAAGTVTLSRGGRQLIVSVDGYSGAVTVQ